MTTHSKPGIDGVVPNVPSAGQLGFNTFVTDFADPNFRPAAIALNDLILIGVIPAGHVMVPCLSRLSLPALEAGTPASDYTIGTEAAPAALKGSAASETAVVLFGEDWAVPAAPIGNEFEDTPIYIKVITANMDAVPSTGKIVFEPVYRAYRRDVDG